MRSPLKVFEPPVKATGRPSAPAMARDGLDSFQRKVSVPRAPRATGPAVRSPSGAHGRISEPDLKVPNPRAGARKFACRGRMGARCSTAVPVGMALEPEGPLGDARPPDLWVRLSDPSAEAARAVAAGCAEMSVAVVGGVSGRAGTHGEISSGSSAGADAARAEARRSVSAEQARAALPGGAGGQDAASAPTSARAFAGG